MSDDMQLQIVLTGTNESGPAIDSLDQAMSGLRQLTEDISRQFSDFSRSLTVAMEQSASAVRTVDEPLQAISTAASEVGRNASEAMHPLEEALQTVARDANEARDAIRNVGSAEHSSGSQSANSHGSHNDGGLLGMEAQMNFMYAGMTTGAMALPMVAAMKQAVGVFGQFDQAVANVNSMLGDTPTQVAALKNQLIQLSKTVPDGPVALANALYGVVGAGVPAADAMNVLKISAEAATAGQTDVATASNALIAVMDSYGMSAKDITKISDQMFAANAAGAMTFTQFANAIGTVAGPAATAGVSFDQVAAATAALTNEGLSAQRSTQGLRALLMGIVAPTKGATKEAKHLGIEWDQNALKSKGMVGMLQEAMKATHGNAQELKKLIPNIAAWTVAVDLGGKGAQSFKNAMNTMVNSSGATAKAMAAQEQGFTEQMDKMKSSLQRVGIELGSALAPTVEKIAKEIGKLATWFSNLSPHMQKVIAVSGAVVAGFLVLTTGAFAFLAGLGAVRMGLESLGILKKAGEMATFAASTVEATAATEGLAAAEGAAAGGGLFATLGSIGAGALSSLKSLGTAMQTVMFAPFKAMAKLPRLMMGLGKGLVSSIASIPKGIGLVFTGITKGFTTMLTFFVKGIPQLIMNFFKLLSIENILKGIKLAFTLLTGPWGILIAAIVAGVTLIITHWSQITDWVKKNFGTSIPQIMDHLKKYMQEAWNAIKSASEAVWNFLKPFIINSVKTVEAYWKKVWPELKQLFQEVWTAMKVILAPTIAWIGLIVVSTLGFIRGAWKNGWEAIKSALKLVWDTMVGVIKIAWNVISGVIMVALDLLTGHWHKAWTDLKTMLSNVWNDIKGLFRNMASDAFNFGRNFIQMLANGIMGSIGAVESAASNVMNKVKGFFGFHSPTKEGPGSESDQWMPNMMNMFIQGIQAHIPKLQSTLSSALGSPFQGASASIGASISHNIAYSGSGFGNNAPNIIVYASGNVTRNEKELGDIVSRAVWGKAKLQGKF